MRSLIRFFSLLIVAAMVGLLVVFLGPGGILRSGPHTQDTTVIIDNNDSVPTMAQKFYNAGVISNKFSFYIVAFLAKQKAFLKAGEYAIKKQSTPYDIVQMLAHGRSTMHFITIPEGLTVFQIINIINETPGLTGHITTIPQEGHVLPETYAFQINENRQQILNRMVKALDKTLDKLWAQRASNCILKTPEDALILASIIEKETGLADERERVAAVFTNRIKYNMRLQSDPTVIYGLTQGRTNMARLLNINDLKTNTPYNTYTINGLPLSPIACPGKQSIYAALHPANTKELYFVANGKGGHTFATNLRDHNKNVMTWRLINKKQNNQ